MENDRSGGRVVHEGERDIKEGGRETVTHYKCYGTCQRVNLFFQ